MNQAVPVQVWAISRSAVWQPRRGAVLQTGMDTLTLKAADGNCPSYVFRPSTPGPWPAVLMYMDGALVKNSLGPSPGSVPESGSYSYRGRRFEVFTLHAGAFPSGALPVRVLVPIPYS